MNGKENAVTEAIGICVGRCYLPSVCGLVLARVIQNSDLTKISLFHLGVYGLYALFLGIASLRILSLIIEKRLSPTELTLSILSLALIIVNYSYFSDFRSVFLLPFLVLSAKDMSFRDLVKATLCGALAGLIIVVSCHYLGLSEGVTEWRTNRLTGGRILRHSYGFTDFNAFGRFVLIIFCSCMYLRWDSFGIVGYIGWACVAAGLYFVAFTKTAAFTIAGCLVMRLGICMYARILSGSRRAMDDSGRILNILTLLVVISVGIGVILPMVYDSSIPLLKSIDRLLTDRLFYTRQFMDAYDVRLLGQDLDLVSVRTYLDTGSDYHVLDNTYYRLILNYGALVFAAFAAAYAGILATARRHKLVPLAFLIFIALMTGSLETWTYIDFAFLLFPALTTKKT